MPGAPGGRGLLARLALQNLGRRRARTGMLMTAVAISAAIVFAGLVAIRSIQDSMAVGFSRLGADLMVVAGDALTNIAVALLTVEPGDTTLPAGILADAAIAGTGRATPQRVFRTTHSGLSGHGESIDLIGFDPATDFTVLPWIAERLPRPIGPGDVVIGAARNFPLGSEIVIFGTGFRVYGKLSPTGAGVHERGVFLDAASLLRLAPAIQAQTGALPAMLAPDRVSGFLIQLAPAASELAVRFALLSRLSGVKVVTGTSLITGIRQGLTALLAGAAALVVLLSASAAVMVGVLFSAIVAERRVELGLLKAIGARRRQIVGMTVIEAVAATTSGGIIGILFGALLLRIFERTLVAHLAEIGVPFLWLGPSAMATAAVLCIAGAALIGALGALIPSWRASRREPHDLIRADG